MVAEEYKTKVQRLVVEAFTKGNVNGLDELLAPDIVFHSPPSPDVKGLEAFKQDIVNLRNAFSDIQFTFYDMIMEGDKYSARWTFSGTHVGQMPHMPVPPTGKRVTFTALSFNHLANDKIVEQWVYRDIVGLMQQMGVAPPTGTATK